MQIEITTRHWDESDRAVELDYVGEATSTQINQLIAGEIGPAAIVSGFFDDSEVVCWMVIDSDGDPDDRVGHGWMHSGVSIASAA